MSSGAKLGTARTASHQVKAFQRFIDVGGIDAQLDNVAQVHIGPRQHGLKVVQCQTDLAAHVTNMLGGTVFIDGGLSCNDQLAGCAINDFCLIVAKVQGPVPWVYCCAFYRSFPLVDVSVNLLKLISAKIWHQ